MDEQLNKHVLNSQMLLKIYTLTVEPGLCVNIRAVTGVKLTLANFSQHSSGNVSLLFCYIKLKSLSNIC